MHYRFSFGYTHKRPEGFKFKRLWEKHYYYPNDFHVRYGVWGRKIEVVRSNLLSFRITCGHDYLNFFYLTFHFAYWMLAFRIVHPYHGFKTGSCLGENREKDQERIRKWIEERH